MAVEVNTTEYEFSHGKKPRGYGYWAFQVGRNPEPFFAKGGTYSEAVREAKQHAASVRAAVVKVLP
jgi:hypothetical protein